jgi:uncharacterized protein YicC (UPF0701 family)
MTEFNKPTQEDWDALAEKQVAATGRAQRETLEDATVRAAHKVMTEFNDTERESKVKQELVKQQLDRLEADVAQLRIKTQELRNDTIEEVALRFEQARDGCSLGDIIGRRWMDSAAELVRSMKK